MQRLHYTKDARRLAALHDELVAAGITPERCEGSGTDVWVTVADGVPEAAVAAVVAAHDPLAVPAREQRDLDDRAALVAMASVSDATIAGLPAAQQTIARALRALVRRLRE